MIINDRKTIAEIQREFSQKFPYLKLEFYKVPHGEGDGSPEQQKLDPALTVDDARTSHKSGDMSINGHLKVSTLEQRFHEDYGLNVQVFRNSGGLWLQTTATDDWTLTEQNERGKNSRKEDEVTS